MSLQRSFMAVRAAAAPQFARAAQRTAAVPTQTQMMTALRSFSSATPSTPTPAPESTAVAAAPRSFTDIVNQYGGWYPFLGLGGAIAVAKEVIILNEELLLVTNFATMFTVLYLGLGDTVTKAAEEARQEVAKRQDDLSDFQIEQIESLIQAHRLNIEQVDVLKRLKVEHNTLSSELARVRALKVRHAARDAVVKKLNEIKSREASERASFKEVVGARATQYVRRQFAAAPANVKSSLVDFAIDVVEGKRKQLDAKADPVKKLYADYFNNKIYLQEIEAEQKQKA